MGFWEVFINLFTILKNISFSVPKKGDCICLLGPSGIGKTTILRGIAGLKEIPNGSIFLKDRILNDSNNFIEPEDRNISQHQVDDLDLTKTAYECIHQMDTQKTEQQVRTYLGGFDFKNDKVKDSIELFSGGEKARLALAMIAYQKPNLLLLDEPFANLIKI